MYMGWQFTFVLAWATCVYGQGCTTRFGNQAALERFYATTAGPDWTNNTNWLNKNASCMIPVPKFNNGSFPPAYNQVQAPADAPYCCWHGVTCCAGLPQCQGNATENCCHFLL